MKRHEIITSLSLPILELSGVIGAYFIAYSLRQITDGIPFIQLPIPYISPDQFLPFVVTGGIFWCIIFSLGGLYRYEGELPLIDIIRKIVSRSLLWLMMYIGFVYLTTGFVFSKEIPRLIIAYVWILSTIFAIFIRIGIHTLMSMLYRISCISRYRILVITSESTSRYHLDTHFSSVYLYKKPTEQKDIIHMIRNNEVDTVLALGEWEETFSREVIELCTIYGVNFAYPKVPRSLHDMNKNEKFIGGIPVVEGSAIGMHVWDRIAKRTLDILISGGSILLLSPLFLLIAIAIKLEDPAGPVIFKNRRIGLGGKEFFVYKFRYMYWKYCVKDAYGIESKNDSALQYEEELKKKSDIRSGPLYKIKNDPRKTWIGNIIEKVSFDELPQLWNVFIGEMSLVGPRPHQPREVDLYSESHYQLLTVKPGITGMAQVSGREKNTFEEEFSYDVYYIEHYSLILDILILTKTFWVVILRAFR